MSAPLSVRYTPGRAGLFIDQLWQNIPAHPEGVLLGVLHLVGDHGQIVVNLRHPQVPQVVVRPEEVLTVPDPTDPVTWRVVRKPDSTRLRLPE